MYTGKHVSLPPVEYLRECFFYDYGTGVLTWKRRPREHFTTAWVWKIWNSKYAGKAASYLNKRGYIDVTIDSRLYLAHRLIWKMMTGMDPPETIDHIDRNRKNNAWFNLRLATRTEQNHNTIRTEGVSGYRNVSRFHRKWRATITIDYVTHHLGLFDTAEEASAAYEAAARKVKGEFFVRG